MTRRRAVVRAAAWGLAIAALGGCNLSAEYKAPTERDVAKRAARHLATIRAQAPLPPGPLSFEDAVARALAHNLDLRVAALEEEVARGKVDLANIDKLPEIVLSAGYAHRDSPLGFRSDTTTEQFTKMNNSAELAFSVLDFGIAYVRSLQAQNDVDIQRETRRRMANQIVNDVRTAYWTVLLGRERLQQVAGLEREMENALQLARRLAELKLQDPLVGLNYRDGLVDLKRQIRTYELDIASAEAQLARLLNLNPRVPVALAPAARDAAYEPLLAQDRAALEEAALTLRSELREADFTLRSRRLDVLRTYVQMMPSLRLRYGAMFDNTNTFRDNHWSEVGYTASLNLLNVARMALQAKVAKRGAAVADLRRLSISLAIMEQVSTVQERLRALALDYGLARESADVRRQIYEKRMSRLPTDVGDELERARAAVGALSAALREDRAYTGLQSAYGTMLAAVGIDQFPDDLKPGAPDAATRIAAHQQQASAQIRAAMTAVAVLGRTDPAPARKVPAAAAKP